MGLAIVRHLVELHGGTVRAHSAGRGQGATFVVRLPQASTSASDDVRPGSEPAGVLRGLRIQVVDDDPDTGELLATILRHAGATVSVARSVDEALAQLSAAPPDVVVCDIAMPGRDGYDLLREARRAPGAPSRIPFVALTAQVQDADRRRVLDAGFAVHVAKPINPNALVDVIRTVSRR
jgi:CheY-like chemotaxis protein